MHVMYPAYVDDERFALTTREYEHAVKHQALLVAEARVLCCNMIQEAAQQKFTNRAVIPHPDASFCFKTHKDPVKPMHTLQPDRFEGI